MLKNIFGNNKKLEKYIYYTIIALIVFTFVFKIYLPNNVTIDEDELRHLHAAWLIYSGERPYSDFFAIHPPLFWYILKPFFLIFGESITLIFAARYFMFFLSLLILYVFYKIVKICYNKEIAILSLFVLSYFNFFIIKTIEVRPCLPMILFCLIGIYFFIRASKSPFYYSVAGIFFGIAFLFKQTALFVFVMLAIFMLLYLALQKRELNLKTIKLFALFSISFLIPFVILCFYFYFTSCLNEFLKLTFLGSPTLVHLIRSKTADMFLSSIYQNTLFWLTGILMLYFQTYSFVLNRKFDKKSLILFLCYGGLLVILLRYSASEQNFLLFIIFLSVYSALFLKKIVKNAVYKKRGIFIFLLFILIFGSIFQLYFTTYHKHIFSKEIREGYIKNKLNTSTTNITTVNAFLSGYCFDNCGEHDFSLVEQLTLIDYILDKTTHSDKVFDSFGGIYIFRFQTSYVTYLFEEAAVDFTLSENAVNFFGFDLKKELLNDLQQGSHLIILDPIIVRLIIDFDQLRAFLNKNYLVKFNKNIYYPFACLGKKFDLHDFINNRANFDILATSNYTIVYTGNLSNLFIDNNSLNSTTIYLEKGNHTLFAGEENKTLFLVSSNC